MHATQEQTVTHSTFVIEKHFPVSPERVFAAFADPVKRRRWNAEGPGSDILRFDMDFRIGGLDRSEHRFPVDSPLMGAVLLREVRYQDIIPNRRIVTVYTWSIGGRPFSSSQNTFELIPTESGTDLLFTEQGAFFENSDGPKMREDGWRLLLDRLAEVLAA